MTEGLEKDAGGLEAEGEAVGFVRALNVGVKHLCEDLLLDLVGAKEHRDAILEDLFGQALEGPRVFRKDG